MKKKMSIVIPTKNEEKNLTRLFQSLEKISDEIEVIIIDSNSTDKTREIAETTPWSRYICQESTPGKARNIGIKHAKTDIIVMLDADTEITDTWFSAVLFGMKHFYVVAGYSPDPDQKDLPRVPVFIDGQDITYPQCNIAYRKALFDDVGFLREDMYCAEDCELHYRCIKKGYTIFYNPEMKAFHYERPTMIGWMRKAIKNGYGRFELNRIHPELKNKHQHGLSLRSLVRLGFGAYGYVKAFFGGKGTDK